MEVRHGGALFVRVRSPREEQILSDISGKFKSKVEEIAIDADGSRIYLLKSKQQHNVGAGIEKIAKSNLSNQQIPCTNLRYCDIRA